MLFQNYDIFSDYDENNGLSQIYLNIFPTQSINKNFSEFTYPSFNNQYMTLNYKILEKTVNLNNIKLKYSIINEIMEQTFILFSFNVEYFNAYYHYIGTSFKLKNNDFEKNVIITNYSILINDFYKKEIEIYAIPLKGLNSNNINLLLQKLNLIFKEKNKILFDNFLKTNNFIYKLKICQNFIDIRDNIIKYINNKSNVDNFLLVGHEFIYEKKLNFIFLEPNDSNITLKVTNNNFIIDINQTLKISSNNITNTYSKIFSLSSIPISDLKNKLNNYYNIIQNYTIPLNIFENLFPNYDILSINFGNILYNENVAYYYKDINFPGEIIYDFNTCKPIGISYVPLGQNENYLYLDSKQNNYKYNLYINFENPIFINFVKEFFDKKMFINFIDDFRAKNRFKIFKNCSLKRLKLLLPYEYNIDNFSYALTNYSDNNNNKEDNVKLIKKKKIININNNNLIMNDFTNKIENDVKNLHYNTDLKDLKESKFMVYKLNEKIENFKDTQKKLKEIRKIWEEL